MRKTLFSTIFLVLFVIGLVVLYNSVPWGSHAASAYLGTHGMDTTEFIAILQESITMYRWFGGILSIIGGFGLVKTLALK